MRFMSFCDSPYVIYLIMNENWRLRKGCLTSANLARLWCGSSRVHASTPSSDITTFPRRLLRLVNHWQRQHLQSLLHSRLSYQPPPPCSVPMFPLTNTTNTAAYPAVAANSSALRAFVSIPTLAAKSAVNSAMTTSFVLPDSIA